MKTFIIVILLVASALAYPQQNAPFRRGTQGRSYGGSRPKPAVGCDKPLPDPGLIPGIDESYGPEKGIKPIPGGIVPEGPGAEGGVVPDGGIKPVIDGGDGIIGDGSDGIVPEGGIKPEYQGGGVNPVIDGGIVPEVGVKPDYEGGHGEGGIDGGVVPEGEVKPGYQGGSFGYGGGGVKPEVGDRVDGLEPGYEGGAIKPEVDGGVIPDGGANPGYGGGSFGYGGGGVKPEVDGGIVPDGGLKPGYGGGGHGGGGTKPEVDGGIVPDGGLKPGYGGGGHGEGGIKPVVDGGIAPLPGKPVDGGIVPDGGVKPGYGGGGYGEGGVKPVVDGGITPLPGKPIDGGIPDGVKPEYGIGGGLNPDHSGIPIGPEGCICVPWYQCKDGEIVTDGSGIIDPRKKYQPKNELPLEDDFKPPQCGKFHVCCGDPSPYTEKPYEHYCGIRKPSGINKKILNAGRKGESEFGEWPWQGALMKLENKDIRLFQCGAVLIDKRHALTAAHCVNKFVIYEKLPLIVRFGEWDTQVTNEFLPHEDFKVERVVIHPGFKNNSLWNDIAVLKFDRDVQYAPHVDTICLPRPDDVFAGQECVVTGWGKNAYKGGTYSNVLREVKVPIIDHHTCQDLLRKTRLGKYFKLHEGFTCAGGAADEDACKGDGGGPIACYRPDGTYSLAGLVSWGIDCGQPNVPGVYVDMTKYLDWIKTVTTYNLEEYWPRP